MVDINLNENIMKKYIIVGLSTLLISTSSLNASKLSMENKICSTENGVKTFKLIKLNGFGLTLVKLADKSTTKFKDKVYHYTNEAKFEHSVYMLGDFFSKETVTISGDGMMEYTIYFSGMKESNSYMCE